MRLPRIFLLSRRIISRIPFSSKCRDGPQFPCFFCLRSFLDFSPAQLTSFSFRVRFSFLVPYSQAPLFEGYQDSFTFFLAFPPIGDETITVYLSSFDHGVLILMGRGGPLLSLSRGRAVVHQLPTMPPRFSWFT